MTSYWAGWKQCECIALTIYTHAWQCQNIGLFKCTDANFQVENRTYSKYGLHRKSVIQNSMHNGGHYEAEYSHNNSSELMKIWRENWPVVIVATFAYINMHPHSCIPFMRHPKTRIPLDNRGKLCSRDAVDWFPGHNGQVWTETRIALTSCDCAFGSNMFVTLRTKQIKNTRIHQSCRDFARFRRFLFSRYIRGN